MRYLLNAMLYYCNCCNILKAAQCHLMSGSNTDSRLFHLPQKTVWETLKFSLIPSEQQQQQKYLTLFGTVRRVSLMLAARLIFGPSPLKGSRTRVKSGLRGDHCFWSSTPNPPSQKSDQANQKRETRNILVLHRASSAVLYNVSTG